LIELYTDGGYSIPRGIGGWAVVVVKGDKVINQHVGTVTNSSSNRAELTAFIKALELANEYQAKQDIVQIFSDSNYVVRGFKTWINGWKQNNWTTATGKDVKNSDLWKKIDSLKNDFIQAQWIKGHNGNKFNELADQLSKV